MPQGLPRHGAIAPAALRFLGTVLSMRAEQKVPTVRAVCQRLGWAHAGGNLSYRVIRQLRAAGALAPGDGSCGTLRATCRFIPAERLGESV